ncbi:hypothetical protein [Hymenobacter psoromatis]|uniref:hypothetical protein n=1 Tax=Hymenobacter psoromatis TaxID=1484116 RepID=UPI001CBE9798|nr:hypothetical protein [Hymenobacter psoromatis]
MKNLISTLGRLAVVLTGALALGSCSRAEYAFLPRSASYLGAPTAAPKARIAATAVATPTPLAQASATAVAPEITVATAPAPVATEAAASVAARPAAVPTPPTAAEVTTTAPATAAAAPQKLSLVQRLALAKVTKKFNKMAARMPQLKKGDVTASTARLDGNLRYAIIFGVISLIFFAIGGSLLNIIGTILLIIGLLFLLFWVLDAL